MSLVTAGTLPRLSRWARLAIGITFIIATRSSEGFGGDMILFDVMAMVAALFAVMTLPALWASVTLRAQMFGLLRGERVARFFAASNLEREAR